MKKKFFKDTFVVVTIAIAGISFTFSKNIPATSNNSSIEYAADNIQKAELNNLTLFLTPISSDQKEIEEKSNNSTSSKIDNLIEKDWIYDSKILSELLNHLNSLPIVKGSVRYMAKDQGFFFDLELDKKIRLTLSKYVDNDNFAYFNIWENKVLVIQNRLPFNDLISSLNEYFS